MPNFAVVIPLFNKGPHIERAIASVRAQTFQPAEIIVVDDGSTDGGLEWVQGQSIPGLVVDQRSAPGPGGYAARNRGIDLATSEWIAFLDADDEWRPQHLEAIARALDWAGNAGRIVSVFSGYEDVYADGRRLADPYSRKVAAGPAELDFTSLIGHWVDLNASPMWTSATVCRRSALLDAGAFPAGRCKRGGDKDTWLRVAHLGTTVFTGAITAHYFRDSVNMTTKRSYSNVVPCIVDSTKRLADIETGAAGQRIRELQNTEIFNYALVSARTEGLQPASWTDFDASLDPIKANALRFLSTGPGSLAARLAFRAKRWLGR